MRMFILARSESEIVEDIYPALARAGVEVAGYGTAARDLAQQLALTRPDVLLVRMTITRRGEERVFLEELAPHPVVVVLPRGRGELAEALGALPHVAGVAVEPVDYAALFQSVDSPPDPAEEPAKPASPPTPRSQTGIRSPAQQSQTERPVEVKKARLIAFASGMLGGTGKSTLAGTLAWMLARTGRTETLLLSLGTPPAALSHFKLARWPDLAAFLGGEAPFEEVVQRLAPEGGDALHVALAPGDPVAYDRAGARARDEGGAVLQALEAATARYDLVIADLPSDSTGWAVHPLLAADDVVLVVRPTVADQAGLVQALTLLQGLRPPTHLVLNGRRTRDLDARAFRAGVEQMTPCPEPVAVVPHDEAVRLAQNEALPLPLAAGTEAVVAALRELAAHLGYALEATHEAENEQVQPTAAEVKDGERPGRRKAFSLPGLQLKLTD